MGKRVRTALWAGLTAVVVSAAGFVLQAARRVGCSLNESMQQGSELDRFCDSGAAFLIPVVLVVLIAMTGAVATVWKLETWPVLAGAAAALLVAFVPAFIASTKSNVAPPRGPVTTPTATPPDDSLVSPPPPVTPAPTGSELPDPREAAALRMTQEVDHVSNAVARCLSVPNQALASCEPPDMGGTYVGSRVEVKVNSPRVWLVTVTEPEMRPPLRFSLFVDESSPEYTRTVRTCAPKEPGVCEHTRVEVRSYDDGRPPVEIRGD